MFLEFQDTQETLPGWPLQCCCNGILEDKGEFSVHVHLVLLDHHFATAPPSADVLVKTGQITVGLSPRGQVGPQRKSSFHPLLRLLEDHLPGMALLLG